MADGPDRIGHLVPAARAEERWDLGGRIGPGGPGTTFRGRRRQDGRTACIKILNDNGNSERRRRFFEEANALAGVSSSRVPRLIETNATGDTLKPSKDAPVLYLATDFVEGKTLAERVGNEGALPIALAVGMTVAILDALAELHPTRVHRDLPLNFFMERYTESFAVEVSAFVDAVLHDKPVPVGGYDGRVPVVMGLAAGKSHRWRRPVKLSEIG